MLPNGKVLIAGGYSGIGNPRVAELFTPDPPVAVIPLTITSQPISVTVNQANNVSFSVTATGSTSYRWQKDGIYISGATTATLVLTNVQLANVGSYSVVVSNLSGSSLTSDVAMLTVIFPPAITTNPIAAIVNQGENMAFTVLHTGSISTYQWKKSGVAITGGTSSTLVLSNVQLANAGSYSVVVSNPAGSVVSNPATLMLLQGSFYSQAQNDASVQTGIQTGLQAGLQAGLLAGRSQVIESPNYFGLYNLSQIQTLNIGSPLLAKDEATGKFMLTIRVKKSTSLTNFTEMPFTTGVTSINAQGDMEFKFTSPDNAAFYRLESY